MFQFVRSIYLLYIPTETKTVISLFLLFSRRRFRDIEFDEKTIHVRNEKKFCVSRILPRAVWSSVSQYFVLEQILLRLCVAFTPHFIAKRLRKKDLSSFPRVCEHEAEIIANRQPRKTKLCYWIREKQQRHSNFGLQPRQASVPQK